MLRILAMLAIVIGSTMPHRAQAEEPADGIQAVIEQQIADFQRDDVTAAFMHAAPSIQAIFGSPETFGTMVRQRYPMIWRPARHEMLKLLNTPAGFVQVVLFEDVNGKLHEAGYLMQPFEGEWRINGVRLRALPGIGT